MLKRLLRSKRSPLLVYSFPERNQVRILLTFGSPDEYLYDFLTGPRLPTSLKQHSKDRLRDPRFEFRSHRLIH